MKNDEEYFSRESAETVGNGIDRQSARLLFTAQF